jgi:hypothetical protein
MTTPATPEPAAAPVVPGKPDAASPRTTITDMTKEGTTSKMFPDFVGTDRVGAPKAPEAAAQPPAAPTDVIDLAALSGKKVTLKVDGKEEVVTVEEALRRAQLDSSLTTRAQALAAKEHEINEREKTLRQQTPPPVPAGQPDLSKSVIADDPAIKLLLKQMEELKTENQGLKALTTPAREDANMRFLAGEVKKIMGQDDFLQYKDAILAEFKALPLDQQRAADNTLWWVGRYSARKFEALSKPQAPAVPAAAPVRPGAPMPGDIAGGGGSTSAAIPATSAQQAAISAAFTQAQRSGNIDDWAYFERLRREALVAA